MRRGARNMGGRLRKGAPLCDELLGVAWRAVVEWSGVERGFLQHDAEYQVVELVLIVDGVKCVSSRRTVRL